MAKFIIDKNKKIRRAKKNEQKKQDESEEDIDEDSIINKVDIKALRVNKQNKISSLIDESKDKSKVGEIARARS